MVTEFIITGVLLAQGKMHGARVHVRRALLAGATPRELFRAITVAHPGRRAGDLARRGDGQG
ncbi:MAG: carboxymuconolactone decarboxylase family protein [Xanthobacteraceae bacterium]|nr:carboxymuconolactone decarboxylase family protein [Xanthobacteraceae bacterium]